MDIKKDTQSRSMLSQQPTGGMESFSISLGKKCERLATALYLVTGFLSDIEPLKGRLRTLSLDLVRDASRVRYGTTSSESDVLEKLRANICETLGLLELAFIAGIISEMNFSILKREYTSLRATIEAKKASRESRADTILGDTFFGSSFTEEKTRPTFIQQTNHQSRHGAELLGDVSLKGRSGNIDLGAHPKTQIPSSFTKGHSIGQKESIMSDTKTKGQHTPKSQGHTNAPSSLLNNVERDARRTRILKLVKDNREVTIKDITTYFPELSEKTIQRELVSLVEANVLKKSGERRWSRYALV